jgi:hypothetical protein
MDQLGEVVRMGIIQDEESGRELLKWTGRFRYVNYLTEKQQFFQKIMSETPITDE